MKKINEEALTGIFEAMIDDSNKQEMEMYQKIIASSKIKSFKDPEEFYFMILYPWKKFVKGLLKTQLKDDNEVIFIFQNYTFIEANFQKLINDIEGMACCADKSGTLIKKLIKFYMTGETIQFDHTAKYTFNLPKVVFTDHDEIVEFYEALKSFHYGDGTKYIAALNNVLTKGIEAND
jgi:hypothetical protein